MNKNLEKGLTTLEGPKGRWGVGAARFMAIDFGISSTLRIQSLSTGIHRSFLGPRRKGWAKTGWRRKRRPPFCREPPLTRNRWGSQRSHARDLHLCDTLRVSSIRWGDVTKLFR
ncbi:hypothetical protein CDAR_587761 [Caerostris darwini]|uniref:Uncharacterized protein n=1 Tax=Caerostris darwini TaxID=1538125 RepID=A0AAV4WX01_9ARAC|nr:hypothetical protein CDAR_587761 [Caerostris darwini]